MSWQKQKKTPSNERQLQTSLHLVKGFFQRHLWQISQGILDGTHLLNLPKRNKERRIRSCQRSRFLTAAKEESCSPRMHGPFLRRSRRVNDHHIVSNPDLSQLIQQLCSRSEFGFFHSLNHHEEGLWEGFSQAKNITQNPLLATGEGFFKSRLPLLPRRRPRAPSFSHPSSAKVRLFSQFCSDGGRSLNSFKSKKSCEVNGNHVATSQTS